MNELKLQMANLKPEVLVVNNCKAHQRMAIRIGEQAIALLRALKHLGVVDDYRLYFSVHIDYICEKCGKYGQYDSEDLAEPHGLRSSNKRLLANVSNSTLRYGMAVALKTRRTCGKLNGVFRLVAMRCMLTVKER